MEKRKVSIETRKRLYDILKGISGEFVIRRESRFFGPDIIQVVKYPGCSLKYEDVPIVFEGFKVQVLYLPYPGAE